MDKSTPVSSPWYKSPVLHSLVVIAVTHTLVHYHIVDKFTSIEISDFVNEFLSWLGYLAVAVATYARIKSPLAPVTLTQKTADTANAVAVPQSTVTPAAILPDPKLPETPK
jgi:hypothetical protein